MSRSPDPLQASQASQAGPATSSTPGNAKGAFAIETLGLRKNFGKLTAVDGLTISVPAGIIAGFIGPNGAGKTTTLRLLLGLVRPSAGSATILGHPLAESDKYLPHVGALIEAPAFYPSLSGRTNLEVLARLGGVASSRVDELLDLVDLSKRARDRVGSYSLGMKQRLGIAMALLPDPDLLILDEPANGLDPLGIVQVRDLLRRLRDQGKTILLSSHLLGELERVTDWLVMINQGTLLFSGPARDLLAQRAELVVEAEATAQLELVERLASGAGYTVTREDRTLRIISPASYANTLNQQIRDAGATGVTIQSREASLESLFLALLKGEHA